jgi:hypothetical protein
MSDLLFAFCRSKQFFRLRRFAHFSTIEGERVTITVRAARVFPGRVSVTSRWLLVA